MNIETRIQGQCVFVSLAGEFVHQNVLKFDELWGSITAEKPALIAIECSEMSYIDSSAIGIFVKCVNKSKHDDFLVVFLDIIDPIKRILSVARLDALFEMYSMDDFKKKFADLLA